MSRILVIDDYDQLGESIRKALAVFGYEVEVATNCAEGLILLRDKPHFDIILLDMKMPGGGGMTVLEGLPPNPPPVIIMTGEPNLVPKPAPAAVRHVLQKYFELDELVAAIEDVLKRPNPQAPEADRGQEADHHV